MSLALARKYRPRTFADVAVQTHVATTLRGAIARDRIANGYLLCGPRGTGKTTLARVLAMALNCEARTADGEPCGDCTSCRRIWAGSSSLDVVEMDAASNRSVDDARELRERAMYAPSGEHGYKVYIVDEAHMLTKDAWNTLLKILEEPPPRVVFVFATTDPQKIAQAAAPVLSRLQRFELRRIGAADIRSRVTSVLAAEGLSAEPDALLMIARAADGSMRDALSLTDQVLAFGEASISAESVRLALGLVGEDELIALLDLIAERRAADVFAAVSRLADAGTDFAVLLTHLAEVLRAQLAVELGGAAPELSVGLTTALSERRGRIAAPDLMRMLGILVEHEPIFRKSSHPQLLFEMLLLRFALLDHTVQIEEVLRGLSGGAGDGGTARPAAAARPSAPSARAAPRLRDAAPPPLADTPVPTSATEPLDINRVAERWDDIVASVRRSGRALVAQLLEDATPVAVTASGVVTLDVDGALASQGLSEAEAAVIATLQQFFPGVTKLTLRSAGSAPPRRYDAEAVRAERAETLRQDPLLDAAIVALDLELLE